MTKIKVCGMKYADNIEALARLPIHYIGFIFYPQSARFVGNPENLPDLPTRIEKVGVFVNADPEYIAEMVGKYALNLVQLHGQEAPEECVNLRSSLSVKVIKAFSIANADSLAATDAYSYACDYFLFDTPTPKHGGSGKQFDWDVLEAYKGTKPFLLSGGIGPDDAPALAKFHHPACMGIDINSRFEIEAARKDIMAVKLFTEQLSGGKYLKTIIIQ